MNPDVPSSEFDPLDELAEEFLARFRRGERPSLAEYEHRHPDQAARIRALFPALVEVERAGEPTDRSGAPGPPDVPLPARVGEFRVLRKVGEGGMGVVYEAVQESLGRHVALKVLPPTRTGVYLERFRREARAAAKLHHTNIVPVFGVGEADGVHFYAMQFIPGQGLDAVLDEVRRLRAARSPASAPTPRADATRSVAARGGAAEGLLTGVYAPAAEPPAAEPPAAEPPAAEPPAVPSPSASTVGRSELAGQPEARYYREVARLGAQVAGALAHAHEQGVLHRDIKPSNLLLDLHGTAWVTDFGLAKADDEGDLTHTGDVVGTLRYMAPERFRGRTDARSEVYALGVTLYELLTLRPAFAAADRVALIEQVCRATPAQPRALDRQIPRDLETVVLKAMARDPADRYPTAAALADDLHRFLADRSVTARRATAAEQVSRWARRNKAVAALLTALVAGSATAAAVFAIQGEQLRGALRDSEDDRKALVRSEGEAVRHEREARLKLLDSMTAEARAKTLGRKPGQRFESLALLDKAAALARELGVLPEKAAALRNGFVAALATPDLYLARTWEGFPNGSEAFDFSGDHSVYARTHQDGTCVVARVADDTVVCRVPVPPRPPGGESHVWLSGDGGTLLVLTRPGGEAHVWRVGLDPVRVCAASNVYHADLRADGRVAVVSHMDGAVSVIDLPDGRVTQALPPSAERGPVGVALHPSEPWVAMARAEPRFAEVWDTRSGTVVARFPDVTPIGAAWHPAGSLLVFSAVSPAELRVYATKSFHPVATVDAAPWSVPGEFPHLRFNPSGDRLVACAWTGDAHLIDARTGRVIHVGPPFVDGVALRWSPDGRRLAGPAAGTRLGVWEVGDGREFRILQGPQARGGHPSFPALHPGGRLVAAVDLAGASVAVLDLETGRLAATLPTGTHLGRPVFDPAGVLWTTTVTQTHRWPVLADAARPERYTVGPPERVAIGPGALARSADAAVWVGLERLFREAFIWRPDRPTERAILPTGFECSHPNVSPDGLWATTAHHTTVYADLWNLRTGEKVERLYTRSGYALPAFSPDNKWLWVNRDGGRLLHLDTWEPGPVTGRAQGRPAFTTDGRLIALETGTGTVRLVETATGRELVRLDNPHQDVLHDLVFTPDGGRLVGCSGGPNAPGVHVWELRLIRRQLAERELDWEAPPLPGADPNPPEVEVRELNRTPPGPPPKDEDPRVTVARMTEYLQHEPGRASPYHYRAHAWVRLRVPERAEADFDTAVGLHPRDAEIRGCRAMFRFEQRKYVQAAADVDRLLADALTRPPAGLVNRAAVWHLILAPPDRRDAAKGLDLARRAAGGPLDQFALGVALLRGGRPVEAVAELDRVRAAGDGYDDLVYPALVGGYTLLGDHTRALEALRAGRAAAARLPAGRLPEYLRLARDRLQAEAAAAVLVRVPGFIGLQPR